MSSFSILNICDHILHTLSQVQNSWVLPDKIFLPMQSIQPYVRYLFLMGAIFDALWGLVLHMWTC